MINLKNLYTGRKFIKEIVEKNKDPNAPWSKVSQEKHFNTHKNLKRKK